MKAVICQQELVDLPTPEPGPGQLLLEVQRCGIYGSDLPARHHGDELADVTSEVGYDGIFRSHQAVVFGHEFTGVVGLPGVDAAFTALADPEAHAKILIDPRSRAEAPAPLSVPV